MNAQPNTLLPSVWSVDCQRLVPYAVPHSVVPALLSTVITPFLPPRSLSIDALADAALVTSSLSIPPRTDITSDDIARMIQLRDAVASLHFMTRSVPFTELVGPLSTFNQLSELRLNLNNNPTHVDVAALLTALPRLTSLYLSSGNVHAVDASGDDDAMASFFSPPRPAPAPSASSSTSLKTLSLSSCSNVSAALFRSLRGKLAALETLELIDVAATTDLFDEVIMACRGTLSSLCLSSASNFGTGCASRVSEFPRLSALDLSYTLVGERELRALAPLASCLATLHLCSCRIINDDAFDSIVQLREITTLDLSGCLKLNAAGIETLAELEHLHVLNVSSIPIDQTCLVAAKGIPQLRKLVVSSALMQNAKAICHVEFPFEIEQH